MEAAPFHGAKAAVFVGGDLLIYRRDTHVIWPGCWDFPGGGREGEETPFACLAREVHEEFGLDVTEDDVLWRRTVPAMLDPGQIAWFFVVQLPAGAARAIRFGDEGQHWALMAPRDVAKLPDLVPGLRGRLMLWLREAGGDTIKRG